jgi:uncharacterized Fe-S cluster-containing MiaB family protein
MKTERKQVIIMVDVKQFKDVYNQMKKISSDDMLKLYEMSETAEEQEFYRNAHNTVLQQLQRKAIEERRF